MLCLAIFAGCGTQNQPPVAAPASEPTPRVVTDLSSISSAPSPSSLAPPPVAPASPTPGAAGESSSDAELHRLFLNRPGTARFAGNAAAPGHEELLNVRAAQFAGFSNTLLHRVFNAMQTLEHGDIASARLPDNLVPAVITATMDKQGKLRELVLERHSGSGAMDRLMIEACKRGLWTSNPPPEALSGNEYKFRIEGRLKNFISTDGRHWTFETYVGLALL